MLGNRDVRLLAGRSNDGGATRRARRPRRPTRRGHGQGHGQARPDAADPLLEMPQADAVRTRSLSALRIGIRRWDGRRLWRCSIGRLPDRLRRKRNVEHPGTKPDSDFRRSPASPRDRRALEGTTEGAAPWEGGRCRIVPMPVVPALRLPGSDALRVRRAIRVIDRAHVRVRRVRIDRALGFGWMSRVRRDVRSFRRARRPPRVFVPPMRVAGRIRPIALLLWRVVRRVTQQISDLRTVQ